MYPVFFSREFFVGGYFDDFPSVTCSIDSLFPSPV